MTVIFWFLLSKFIFQSLSPSALLVHHHHINDSCHCRYLRFASSLKLDKKGSWFVYQQWIEQLQHEMKEEKRWTERRKMTWRQSHLVSLSFPSYLFMHVSHQNCWGRCSLTRDRDWLNSHFHFSWWWSWTMS
jgi:hypothetical protein